MRIVNMLYCMRRSVSKLAMSNLWHKMSFLYFWSLYNISPFLIEFHVSTAISTHYTELLNIFVISKPAMSTIIYNGVNGRRFVISKPAIWYLLILTPFTFCSHFLIIWDVCYWNISKWHSFFCFNLEHVKFKKSSISKAAMSKFLTLIFLLLFAYFPCNSGNSLTINKVISHMQSFMVLLSVFFPKLVFGLFLRFILVDMAVFDTKLLVC